MDTTESHNTASALPTPTKDSVHPEAGLKTSDFYKTKNIPERFNHPDWFEGYNSKPDHPFYRTSSSIHGCVFVYIDIMYQNLINPNNLFWV